MELNKNTIALPDIIGKGYGKFWKFKGRYRVVKGGRGSKKSCTTALWLIYNIMKMPLANALVVRKFYNTHRDSTFAQLKWAINRLGVNHLWKTTMNPLEMIYLPTGQKILFRGFDDPQSITSITVERGYLCWCWIEEAFQITDESEFNKLDMSIRGELPPGYFKQITLTFNPWSENIWIKKRFFDADPDDDIFTDTTNYLCNEFLGEDDIRVFNKMKEKQPRRYSIEGLGNWGIAEGLIFNNWRVENFDENEILSFKDRHGMPIYQKLFGLDWGYTAPTGVIYCLASEKDKKIYIPREYYKLGVTNIQLVQDLKDLHWDKELIKADSAEPKSIAEVRQLGLTRIRPAKKGPDSVRAGILKLQDYDIIVHPRCEHTIIELNNYVWDTNTDGKIINEPIDDYNHLMDPLRYACENLSGNNFSF